MLQALALIVWRSILAFAILSASCLICRAQSPEPLRVTDDAFESMVTKRVEPVYPPLIKAAGVGGPVTVELTVDELGKVVSARVTSGPRLLWEAAASAAKQWEFKPARVNGNPVKMMGRVKVDFSNEINSSRRNEEVAKYKKEAAANPTSAEALYRLGKAYASLASYDEAITAFKHALDIEPKFVTALLELANAYYQQSSYKEAMKVYKRVLDVEPDCFKAQAGIAACLERIGRYDDALEVWKHVLSLKPNLTRRQEVYRTIARIYEAKGDIEHAIEAYEHLISVEKQIRESMPDAWTSSDVYAKIVAELYEKAERLEEAIRAHREAITLEPNSAFVPAEYCEIGRLYEKLGRWNEALESYKQAIILHPEYSKPHFLLGSLYVRLNDKNSARSEYEVLKTLDMKMASELLKLIEQSPASQKQRREGSDFTL